VNVDALLFELAQPTLPLIQHLLVEWLRRIVVDEWGVGIVTLIFVIAAAHTEHLEVKAVDTRLRQRFDHFLLTAVRPCPIRVEGAAE
jgi:hypothetical protein